MRLLPLLLGLLAAIALALGAGACAGDEVETTTQAPADSSSAVSLQENASPSEVQQALIGVMKGLGPVRVEATERRDLGGGQELHSEIEQLIDPQSGLARETVARQTLKDGEPTGAVDNQLVSVIELEMVRMYQGQEAPKVSRYTRLREQDGLPLPVYGLDITFVERAVASQAKRLEGGGWELTLQPQMDAVQAGVSFEQPVTLRLVLGPDLLPREAEVTSQAQVGSGTASVGPDGATVTTETISTETYTTRTEYRITPIDPLQEPDVTLKLPEGYELVDEARELPLDRPAAEGWPQYWLGAEALGLSLRDATYREYRAGEAGTQKQVMLVYRRSESEAVPSLMLTSRPRSADEEDDWEERTAPAQEGDSTSRLAVAGREATVHMRLIEDPLPAFFISIVFPDAVVELTGYGVEEEQAREALEALRTP